MATKINGKQIDLQKAPVTGSNSTLLHDIGAGLTLTGSVFLLANPSEDLQAATKQYVDSQTGGSIPTRSIAFGQADGSGFAGDKELVYLTGSVQNEFGGALIYGRFDGFPQLVTSKSLPSFVPDGSGSVVFNTSHIYLTSSALVGVKSAAVMEIEAGTTLDIKAGTNAVISAGGTLFVTGAGATRFGDDTGTLRFDGSGAVTTSGVTSIDFDGSGAINIESTGGAISIGADNVDQSISIGTQGSRPDLKLGNTSVVTTGLSGTLVGILGGSGGVTVDAADGGAISLDAINAASNFTVKGAALTLSGSGINIDGENAEVDITTAGELDVNVGSVDLDSTAGIAITGTTIDIDATGAVTIDTSDGNAISLDAINAASNFTVLGAALTLSGSGINIDGENAEVDITTAGTIDINGADIEIDGSGAVTVESSGGEISVGADNVAQKVNIATAGARPELNLGSAAVITAGLTGTQVGIAGGAAGLSGSSTSGIALQAQADVSVTAGTTFALFSGNSMSIQAQDGGIAFTTGDADNVSFTLGDNDGNEQLSILADDSSVRFSVDSAGNTTLGAGVFNYSGVGAIQEPDFYFTSSVLHPNVGDAGDGQTPNGVLQAFSSSLGATGVVIEGSAVVFLNGLRQLSGSAAQVTAGTKDYVATQMTSGSVNYLIVSMSSAPVAGDVLVTDFRRSI